MFSYLHPVLCCLLLNLGKQIPGALEGKLSLPLKFGLILASYPEVLPISLSRKSEGDMGLAAERAASASLEAARLRGEESRGLMVALPHAAVRPQPGPEGPSPEKQVMWVLNEVKLSRVSSPSMSQCAVLAGSRVSDSAGKLLTLLRCHLWGCKGPHVAAAVPGGDRRVNLVLGPALRPGLLHARRSTKRHSQKGS